MHEVFTPLGVNVSLPSLRVNHQLRSLPKLMQGVRKAGLTLAPEVARDDMREQIRKPIKNDDLYEGCREAFKDGLAAGEAVLPVRPARRAAASISTASSRWPRRSRRSARR